jgi:hypothetical protein
MAKKTLYICDRCDAQTLEDRSAWRVVSIEYRDRGYMLCPSCVVKLDVFLRQVREPALQ